MANASGMNPDKTVVIIEEDQGETSINITNTDNVASLLISTVYDPEGSDDELVLISPPMARVEPDGTQSVRLMLESTEPSPVQRLRRVIFEGMLPNTQGGTANVGVSFRHDLPVIITPKGLKQESAPWKFLKWSVAQDQLVVKNPSPYVIRLVTVVDLLPGEESVTLPNSYILPGQRISLTLPKGSAATKVSIKPANLYGFPADPYNARIEY